MGIAGPMTITKALQTIGAFLHVPSYPEKGNAGEEAEQGSEWT
jgi:hypothetical protein